MITRRTAISAGLVFASAACATGFDAYGATTQDRRRARSFDALLLDETIELPRQLPRQLVAYVQVASPALPVVGIRLDVAEQAGLMRILDKSDAIIGISSGATLFCLERIAWDHGYRLTARSQRNAGDVARRQDVAAFLAGSHPSSASPSSLARAYRPSRADDMLHVWTMHKTADARLHQIRREA